MPPRQIVKQVQHILLSELFIQDICESDYYSRQQLLAFSFGVCSPDETGEVAGEA